LLQSVDYTFKNKKGIIMRAKELVPILAENLNIPAVTAFQIDRSLAENGYRTKGKAGAWPEMGRMEALYFLIGCMTADKPTKAAEPVKKWINAVGFTDIPEEEFLSNGSDEARDWAYWKKKHNLMVQWLKRDQWQKRDKPTGDVFSDFLMSEYLFYITELIAKKELHPDAIELRICTSHNQATFHYRPDGFATIQVGNFRPHKHTNLKHDINGAMDQINSTNSVSGFALSAIATQTEYPFKSDE
jgi:hypothetical protein